MGSCRTAGRKPDRASFPIRPASAAYLASLHVEEAVPYQEMKPLYLRPPQAERQKNLRAKLAASFITNFQDLCLHLLEPGIVREYREHSIMKGRKLDVLRGTNAIPAVAEEIDDMCRLVVRYTDGTTEALSSGEVSIRL